MGIRDLLERPWLLLPGTLCTGAVFDPFLDALGVTDIDRRYVELGRPDVEGFGDIFEQVTSDTVVCGFSLGAIVAAHAANQMTPHSLILFGLNPFADDPGKAEGRQALSQDVQRLGGATALCERSPDVYGPAPDKTRDAILAMADETAHLIDAQTRLALTRPGALPALAQCNATVLCLTGSRDAAAPPTQGRTAAQSAPNGRFYELEGLGHFAIMEAPETCANAVRGLYEVRYEPF